jgi:hypothetical protein
MGVVINPFPLVFLTFRSLSIFNNGRWPRENRYADFGVNVTIASRKGRKRMFCPVCKAEYRPGFTTCTDCNVELVQELSTKPKEDLPGKIENHSFKEILFSFNPGDIAFIKSVLDAEGITYYFHGEHFNSMRPLALPARLMVIDNHVERAKDILKDAKLSIMAINTSDDSKTEEASE